MATTNKRLTVPQDWANAVSTWVSSLHARGLSQKTVALYRSHISQLARGLSCSPEAVTPNVLEAWCAKRRWAAETRRSAYLVYGQFFGHFSERNECSDPTTDLTSPPPPQREPRPAPEDAIAEALRNADPRVSLMIHLGATLGLRIGEMVLIHRDDIEQEVSGPVLRVHGKGNKKRSLPVSSDFANELLSCCERGNGWALPSQRGSHLQPHSASAILSAALPGKWTAHTLRHRFATRAYEVDRDILTVQRLLGHSSVATTMRYAKPPREALMRAVQGATFGTPGLPPVFIDFRASPLAMSNEGLRLRGNDGAEYVLKFDKEIERAIEATRKKRSGSPGMLGKRTTHSAEVDQNLGGLAHGHNNAD